MSEVLEAVDRLKEAYNRHDLDALARCFDDGSVLVSPDGIAEGPEQIASLYGQFMEAFPDTMVTPQSLVVSSRTLASEYTITGVHKGPFLIPGGGVLEETGRPITVRACCVTSVEGGVIASHRIYYDQLELVTQLGGCALFESG
jgi:hypothetical protein